MGVNSNIVQIVQDYIKSVISCIPQLNIGDSLTIEVSPMTRTLDILHDFGWDEIHYTLGKNHTLILLLYNRLKMSYIQMDVNELQGSSLVTLVSEEYVLNKLDLKSLEALGGMMSVKTNAYMSAYNRKLEDEKKIMEARKAMFRPFDP